MAVKKRAGDLEGQKARKPKKPRHPALEIVENPSLDESTEDFKELDPTKFFSYGGDVEDWLAENEYLNAECKAKLYSFNKEGQREFIKQYTGEVPSWDQIGVNYGAGRFEIIMTVFREGIRKVFSRKMYLHESYNNRMLSEVRENGQQVIHVGGNNNNAMSMMKEVMSMIVPLLSISQQNSTPDFSEVMMKNYDMMQKVMQRSLTDNAQFLNDMQRENMGLTEVVENDEESTGVMGMINTIMPMLEKFLPLILGKPNPVQAATIEAVKKTPQFLKIAKDQRNIKYLASFIDQKHGKDTTKKLLSRFKLKRPSTSQKPEKPPKKPVKTT